MSDDWLVLTLLMLMTATLAGVLVFGVVRVRDEEEDCAIRCAPAAPVRAIRRCFCDQSLREPG